MDTELAMDNQQGNIEEFQTKISSGEVTLGNGAQFWVYISPQNETAKYVKDWKVTFAQKDGNWTGSVSSEDSSPTLQTPGLSGIFNVTVLATVGAVLQPRTLQPQAGSNPDIGCNSNCAAMVGIVATPGGANANYWTTWDAICSRGGTE
jgi:hypothetical protein